MMKLASRLGSYSIVQKQPSDDGDAAVYEVRASVREELDRLLQVTGLQREICSRTDLRWRYSIPATQRELFEVVSALVETIDYDNSEDPTER